MDTTNLHDDFISQAMAKVMNKKMPTLCADSIQGGNIIIDHASLSYCQYVLAKLIHEDGQKIYLPIFERITLELQKLERDNELEKLAMDLVINNHLRSDNPPLTLN